MESVTVRYNDTFSLRLSQVDWTGYETDPLKGHSPFLLDFHCQNVHS